MRTPRRRGPIIAPQDIRRRVDHRTDAMTPEQPQPISVAAPTTTQYDVRQLAQRQERETEPAANGRPKWTPDEGDFS